MITATAIDMEKNFDRYLYFVMSETTIIVTKDGAKSGALFRNAPARVT